MLDQPIGQLFIGREKAGVLVDELGLEARLGDGGQDQGVGHVHLAVTAGTQLDQHRVEQALPCGWLHLSSWHPLAQTPGLRDEGAFAPGDGLTVVLLATLFTFCVSRCPGLVKREK